MDIEDARILVDKAIFAEDDMVDVAAETKVDLDQPMVLAATLKATASQLSPADKLALQNSLNAINAQRTELQRLRSAMANERQAFSKAIDREAKLAADLSEAQSSSDANDDVKNRPRRWRSSGRRPATRSSMPGTS